MRETMKHLSEEDLILIYYNEPGPSAEMRSHASECPECRDAANLLAYTLGLCNEWKVPEPDAAFERRLWAGLAPAIAARPASRFTLGLWFAPGYWMAAAAVVLLMAGAFVLGRVSANRSTQNGSEPMMAGLSNQARQRILDISLADHLDRAGRLLTEISNTDAPGMSGERGRAQDLVEEGRLMRQMLKLRGETSMLAFLDEVERVLLEVANTPDAVSAEEMRAVRERIGSSSLLFKVRVIEANLRTQGQRL
jgi:hypothetical protein